MGMHKTASDQNYSRTLSRFSSDNALVVFSHMDKIERKISYILDSSFSHGFIYYIISFAEESQSLTSEMRIPLSPLPISTFVTELPSMCAR